MRMTPAYILVSILSLSACGGGGGSTAGTDDPRDTPDPPANDTYTVTVETTTEGGNVRSTSTDADSGEVLELDLTPEGELSVLSATGCGGTLDRSGPAVYTTGPVSADCVIEVAVGEAAPPPELEISSLPGKVDIQWSGTSAADIYWSTDANCDWRNYMSCEGAGAVMDQANGSATLDASEGEIRPDERYFFVSQTPAGVSELRSGRALRVTPRTADAMIEHEGTLFVASKYGPSHFLSSMGTSSVKLMLSAYDTEHKKLVADFPEVSGQVRAAVPDGEGWIIAGDFDAVADEPRTGIARITAQGAVDRDWELSVEGGDIAALEKVGDTLVVGGSFTHLEDQSRQGFATVDLNTLALHEFEGGSPLPNITSVYTLVTADGVVYASGSGHIAAYDAGKEGRLWSVTHDGFHVALSVDSDRVYAAGHFDVAAGEERHRILALDKKGNLLPWQPELPDSLIIESIGVANGVAYVVGQDLSDSYLGAFSTESGEAAQDPLVGNLVYAMSHTPAGLVAVGRISAGGERRTGAYNLTTNEPLDIPLQFEKSRFVTMAANDTEVLFGGLMRWHSDSSHNLYAYETDSGASKWMLDLGDLDPRDMVVHDNTLYVAGRGSSDPVIKTVDLGSDLNTGEILGISGRSVNALALRGDILYLGGMIDAVGGESQWGLAAYDLSTNEFLEWPTAEPRGEVFDIVLGEESLYVSGAFSRVGAESRTGVARLDLATGALSDWSLNDYLPQYSDGTALALSSDHLALATSPYGIEGEAIVGVFDIETGQVVNLSSEISSLTGVVWSLTFYQKALYAGGRFNPEFLGEGACCFNAMSVDLESGEIFSLGEPYDTVNKVIVGGGRLYMAGDFWEGSVGYFPILTAIDLETGVRIW